MFPLKTIMPTPSPLTQPKARAHGRSSGQSEERELDAQHFVYPPTVNVPQTANTTMHQPSQQPVAPQASSSAPAHDAVAQAQATDIHTSTLPAAQHTALKGAAPPTATGAQQLPRWQQLAQDTALNPCNPYASDELDTATSPAVSYACSCLTTFTYALIRCMLCTHTL